MQTRALQHSSSTDALCIQGLVVALSIRGADDADRDLQGACKQAGGTWM